MMKIKKYSDLKHLYKKGEKLEQDRLEALENLKKELENDPDDETLEAMSKEILELCDKE